MFTKAMSLLRPNFMVSWIVELLPVLLGSIQDLWSVYSTEWSAQWSINFFQILFFCFKSKGPRIYIAFLRDTFFFNVEYIFCLKETAGSEYQIYQLTRELMYCGLFFDPLKNFYMFVVSNDTSRCKD